MTITDVAGAQALGIDPEKLDILLTRCRKDVDDGLLPSCQVALARDGRLAAFETFGTSTNDTRYVIFSATKAVVASAVWLLIADGSLTRPALPRTAAGSRAQTEKAACGGVRLELFDEAGVDQ